MPSWRAPSQIPNNQLRIGKFFGEQLMQNRSVFPVEDDQISLTQFVLKHRDTASMIHLDFLLFGEAYALGSWIMKAMDGMFKLGMVCSLNRTNIQDQTSILIGSKPINKVKHLDRAFSMPHLMCIHAADHNLAYMRLGFNGADDN